MMDQFTLETVLLPSIKIDSVTVLKKDWSINQTLLVIEEENIRWTYFKIETSLDYPGDTNTLWTGSK